MKKMLYVGHSYHLKTKSVLFLIEILKKEYDINFISFDPYTNSYDGLAEAQESNYDVLLTLQIMPEMDFLVENFRFEQGVVVPMYDQIITRDYDPWPEYRGFKVLCFSETLHNQLIRRGYRSYYIQYFPRPFENIDYGNPKSVFFWQRLEKINIKVVSTLLEDMDIEHIHIHKSLDPNQKFIEPDSNLNEIITYSEWFDHASEMQEIMQESAFYIAPRIYEGIGMSFLEAMAMGRCVIAPNEPTMNEYITNGVNGILYDVDHVEPVSIEDVRRIQENSIEYIQKGYRKWEECKGDILKWIAEDIEQPLVTVVTVEKDVVKNGRADMFRQCVESVHNQLYPNVQHLVIDGASVDGTIPILDEYKRLGWLEYVSEADSGMYEAMNKGIKQAKGKYIVFLNTDDYFHNPNAIKESVYSLENSQSDFSFASNRLLSEDGICDAIRKPEIGSFVAQMPFCHQTMFAKKSMLDELGMFDERYKSSADYDLVLRAILSGYRYVEVETDIVTYRRGGVSEGSQMRSDEEKRNIFRRIYKNHYEKAASSEFASHLAGRICPIRLYENLKRCVSQDLYHEMEKAIVKTDEDKQVYYLPEEIVVPMKQPIFNGTSSYNEYKEAKTASARAKEERLNKFIKYFALLDRWLWLKLQKKNICTFFEKRGYKKIAIYGMGEIGNRLYEDLTRFSDITVVYAIDKVREEHPTLPIYKIEDELPEVDVVIVSTNNIFNQVSDILKDKVAMPVISIDDVIFDIE